MPVRSELPETASRVRRPGALMCIRWFLSNCPLTLCITDSIIKSSLSVFWICRFSAGRKPMRRRPYHLFTLLAVVVLLVVSVGGAGASGGAPMSDWSAWQAYFTPIVPPSASGPGSPAGRPIPTKSPSFAELQAWVNMIPSLPEPAMTAHAEEVARGVDHSTIVGHGPAKSEPASTNAWAVGGVLKTTPTRAPSSRPSTTSMASPIA